MITSESYLLFEPKALRAYKKALYLYALFFMPLMPLWFKKKPLCPFLYALNAFMVQKKTFMSFMVQKELYFITTSLRVTNRSPSTWILTQYIPSAKSFISSDKDDSVRASTAISLTA